MAGTRYEIRVLGRLDRAARQALAGLEVHADGEVTRLVGELDQADLRAVLERIQDHRLALLEVRALRGDEPAP